MRKTNQSNRIETKRTERSLCITTNNHSDCSIPVAAESGGDFYKNYSFNVAGGGAGGRSKASTSAASSQASGSCPASGATSASAAAAASGTGTGATAATTLDEHVSRANSRRLVGRSLITDTETKEPKQKPNPSKNQTQPTQPKLPTLSPKAIPLTERERESRASRAN